MEGRELIRQIQNMLASSEKVLLVSCGEPEIERLLSERSKRDPQKKVVLLSEHNVNRPGSPNIEWIGLPEDSFLEIQKLYLSYEFSDQFTLLSADGNFGTILNYVKTGLLSAEEAVCALLD